jgi:hypothetical protein
MTTTSDDTPERIFAEPELDLLAKVIQRRLERLNAEGPEACPADLVESTAWLLAEQVVEFFHIRWRDEKSIP